MVQILNLKIIEKNFLRMNQLCPVSLDRDHKSD